MKTTFKEIKKHNPSFAEWDKLLRYYKPKSLDESVTIAQTLKSNGIVDALWFLRAVKDRKKVMLLGCDIAESVISIFEDVYPDDKRISDSIRATRDFCNGNIDEDAAYKIRRSCYSACADAADKAFANGSSKFVKSAFDAASFCYAIIDINTNHLLCGKEMFIIKNSTLIQRVLLKHCKD